MSKSKYPLLFAALGVVIFIVVWGMRHRTSPINPLSSPERAEKPVRPPGRGSREARLLAAEAEERVAGAVADGLDPDTDTLENARLVGSMPATAGYRGIWSGVMPSDAAIGGRVAYAVAQVGDSRASLRPDQFGTFQRAYVPLETDIKVMVRYPGLASGELVSIGVLDGGEMEGSPVLAADKAGSVTFNFKSGPNNGSHRVMLTAANDVKILDFWAGPHEEELRHLSNSSR